MQIAYIGIKEIKGDNIAQTGLVWTRGQVHEVADEKKSLKLLEHSLIWAKVDGKSAEEIAGLMVQELKAVPPEPRASFIPDAPASPYWEPFVTVVPEEVLKKLQAKELVPVFMSEADADAFGEWKLDRDTRPSAPQKTGPRAQAKETKAGTDTKAGLDAAAKKVA